MYRISGHQPGRVQSGLRCGAEIRKAGVDRLHRGPGGEGSADDTAGQGRRVGDYELICYDVGGERSDNSFLHEKA